MSTPAPPASDSLVNDFLATAKAWAIVQGKWWGMAILFHVLGLGLVGLLAGTVAVVMNNGELPPLFESVNDTAIPESDLTQFDITDAPLEASVLTTESLMITEPQTMAADAQFNDDSAVFTESGGGLASATDENAVGMGNFIEATGPGASGNIGAGTSKGLGTKAGKGGAGEGFGDRGSGSRNATPGGTKATERAVSGGLSWLARHQNVDGSWSFDAHTKHCKDTSCTGEGDSKSNAAATAFALLPFLAVERRWSPPKSPSVSRSCPR